MSIDERPVPPPPSASASASPGDRLRVITAGVDNIEARLGTSGFEVVAVAATEDALLVAVSTDEPDAIVVEADLCESLERVRDLAPDAVLIVVGDHTPAGALGRIERGVSGTVMAGLLHALVAEGVAGAAALGLVPAFAPPSGLRFAQRLSGSLTSANAELVRAHVAKVIHDHAELVAAASTVVVAASVSLLFMVNTPRTEERAERVADPTPAVDHAGRHPVAQAPPTTRLAPDDPDETKPGHRRAPRPDAPTGPPRHGHPPLEHGHPREGATQRATSDASRPPGLANGWDHRPPKHEDTGHRNGWTNNSVPEDLPPGHRIRPRMPQQARSSSAPRAGSRRFASLADGALTTMSGLAPR